MYFSVLEYRMTFWPSFPASRNDLGNWARVKDMITSLARSTEFRGGSCCDSPGDSIFAKFCHSTVNLHTTGLAGDW